MPPAIVHDSLIGRCPLPPTERKDGLSVRPRAARPIAAVTVAASPFRFAVLPGWRLLLVFFLCLPAFAAMAQTQQQSPPTDRPVIASPSSVTPEPAATPSPPVQAPIAQAQPKIDELLRLLRDPDIRQWLQSQPPSAAPAMPPAQAAPDPASMDMMASGMTAWEDSARSRIDTIVSAIPRIPAGIVTATMRLQQDAMAHDFGPVSLLMAGLVLVVLVLERIFLEHFRRNGSSLHQFLPVLVFSAAMALLFFAFEWPPLGRIVVAGYLAAFVAYRLTAIAISLTAHPQSHRRLKLIVATIGIAVATVIAASVLDIEPPVRHAIAYLLSCVLLALAIEAVWARMNAANGFKLAASLYLLALWIVWCVGLRGIFWLGLYAFVLPPILTAVSRTLREKMTGGEGNTGLNGRAVLFVRGSRAVIIALAVAWIALIWDIDKDSLIHDNPQYTALFNGILKSVIVLLLADIVWHLAKATIDRRALPPADGSPAAISHEAHATRLLTLLPILRNVLAVVLFVLAGLIVLAQLGVEIAPLIAGAGIVGVAIGFGSQTLVKDVISGFFYLFDDAFRVGEYIQAKTYKGTVEGFSLRSVRLRHHRGPIFTIPFGELGAVENMSRDWAKAKFLVSVPYDTDLEKARKIGKAIGQQLLEDPEFGSVFIQPLKMKGVEDFGEYGIVISFAMVTIPTNQLSFIRRKAYAMLRDAFHENGIAFAQPTVNVGGGDANGGAAAAAEARRVAKAADVPES